MSKFSIIDEAEISFHPLTVIIGPQASGKSVLCKLSYFFLSLMQEEVRIITEGQGISAFKEAIEEKFFRWFPLGTWGPHKFEMSFRATGYEIRIARSTYAGKATDKIRIGIAEPLIAQFEEVQKAVQALRRRAKGNRADLAIDDPLPRWETQEAVRRSLRKLLQKDYIDGQLFVPAGRSFFTSIGKAYALFENSDSIDPLTLEFGRLFAARMDRDSYLPSAGNKAIGSYMHRAIAELMKGEMIRKKNKDYLRTPDGRQIPITAMSSGQQELLPLLRVLPRIPYPQQYKRVFYIEEPEAHLFPDAQSALVTFLTTLLNLYRTSVDLVLTTHSPYVLSKFNNLIKAGSLGRNERLKEAISQIIRPDAWLRNSQLAAYAICDRRLVSVVDPDGLINGDYLDNVSGDMANEFDRLLAVGAET